MKVVSASQKDDVVSMGEKYSMAICGGIWKGGSVLGNWSTSVT